MMDTGRRILEDKSLEGGAGKQDGSDGGDSRAGNTGTLGPLQ